MKQIILPLAVIFIGWTSAVAQTNPMDTCQTADTCDTAANQLIASALDTMETGYYRDAARTLYPVVLNRTISPLTKARAANALSSILEQAELYVHAAGQKANAITVTRAPASEDLLAYARLLAKAEEEEAMSDAYEAAMALALTAGNLKTFDSVVADYQRQGNRKRVRELEALRSEVELRAEAACALANCQPRGVSDARIINVGEVAYPSDGRRRKGSCQVTLNITEDARPVDIVAECTDPVFIEPALIAVQNSTFSARFKDGRPEPRYNIIMPFDFSPG